MNIFNTHSENLVQVAKEFLESKLQNPNHSLNEQEILDKNNIPAKAHKFMALFGKYRPYQVVYYADANELDISVDFLKHPIFTPELVKKMSAFNGYQIYPLSKANFQFVFKADAYGHKSA